MLHRDTMVPSRTQPRRENDSDTAHHAPRPAVARNLDRFIEDEALPGTGIESDAFWKGFAAIVDDLSPSNRALLAERDRLQSELDAWHRAHPGPIARPCGISPLPRPGSATSCRDPDR